VIGALPYWERLRRRDDAQAVLRGVNAAVVGLLLAALYSRSGPVRSTLPRLQPGAGGVRLLVFWKLPPWIVVIVAAIGGALLTSPTDRPRRIWRTQNVDRRGRMSRTILIP